MRHTIHDRTIRHENQYDTPPLRYGHRGLARDRKARIADMLHQLEDHVSGPGYDILQKIMKEVER